MADIFISYKKEDAGRVIRMVEALRAEGFDVWWDHGIQAGSEWDRSIHKELYAAKVVIAIWSKASVAAPWVKEEATVGKNRGVLLPARIDEVDPPLGFMMIQAADLIDWRGDRKDPRWAFFLEAVRSIMRGGAGLAAAELRSGSRRAAEARSCSPSWRFCWSPARRLRAWASCLHADRRRSIVQRRWSLLHPPRHRRPRRRSPRASRSSGTRRWRRRPARPSSPICSPIRAALMRSAPATRC